MNRTKSPLRSLLLAALTVCVASFSQAPASLKPGVLTREQAAAILPPSVFYRGQSATIQGRNSGGIKLPDGKLVLAAVVDTGGYSTSIQQTYQAYLITEVPLVIGGKTLAPGAYGFGFVAGDKLVVMDVGANEVLTAATVKDAALTRPNPLHIVADASAPGQYRLYMGRSYVAFATK
jgi:hypothetical protein